jgi:uncharacterized protein
MRAAAIAASLTMLVIVGGCNGGSGPAAAKETAACDGVPQLALAGRVTDAANILPAEDEVRLSGRLARYERDTQHQMVIVTTPSLHGVRIDNFGTCLGNRWKMGRQGHDDGVIVVIAPNERQMRIATGIGMALAIVHRMTPYFAKADYSRGLSVGIDAIAAETGDKP